MTDSEERAGQETERWMDKERWRERETRCVRQNGWRVFVCAAVECVGVKTAAGRN